MKRIATLEKNERSVLIGALIHFGSGEHAYPSEENLEFFSNEYAAECLEKAAESENFTQEGRLLALTALAKVKGQ